MYSQCAVVMRSVQKVLRGLVLCKRETSPEETHTDTALQNHTTGPTHGPPSPIHTTPQHLNDVPASRYHRTETLFFPGRSDSSMHLQPTPQIGIRHQAHSPTTASQRTPDLSDGLYLSRGLIPEYLPCSFASPNSCDWREGNRVRCQHLEPPALSFLSCGLSPQITKTLYSSDSNVQQRVSCRNICFTQDLSISMCPTISHCFSRKRTFC